MKVLSILSGNFNFLFLIHFQSEFEKFVVCSRSKTTLSKHYHESIWNHISKLSSERLILVLFLPKKWSDVTVTPSCVDLKSHNRATVMDSNPLNTMCSSKSIFIIYFKKEKNWENCI